MLLNNSFVDFEKIFTVSFIHAAHFICKCRTETAMIATRHDTPALVCFSLLRGKDLIVSAASVPLQEDNQRSPKKVFFFLLFQKDHSANVKEKRKMKIKKEKKEKDC